MRDLGLAVGDLRLLWRSTPARAHEIASALLDLLGATLAFYDPAAQESLQPAWTNARGVAAEALEEHMNGDLVTWLSHEVLANARSQPLRRRQAAAWLLIGRHIPGSELALLTATRDGDARLRAIALEALAGFDSEAVHRYFVQEFARSTDCADPLRMLAERHFRAVEFQLGSSAIEGLVVLARRELIEEDWRRASQAVVLSHALPDEAIVPWLIEALARWKSRGEKGIQALRVEHEIERQLEQRSGRKLGLEPENWLAWWDAVRQGKVKKASTPSGWPEPTRPSFFGLDPRSDRVLFVVDRSGSMATPFDPAAAKAGTRTRTRWEEATQQLLEFAKSLGEQARLGIVLFHDYADPWRARLVPANERNLSSARQWLTGQRPNGGTQCAGGSRRGCTSHPRASRIWRSSRRIR
jgi:hypothetical protein